MSDIMAKNNFTAEFECWRCGRIAITDLRFPKYCKVLMFSRFNRDREYWHYRQYDISQAITSLIKEEGSLKRAWKGPRGQ